MRIFFTIFIPALFVFSFQRINAQCSTTSNPYNDCSGGCYIGYSDFNGVPSQNGGGCTFNAYSFNGGTPRNFTIGATTTYSIITGNVSPPGQGIAIWVDLNNDNIYQNSEMVASSTPKYIHTGSFVIPLNTAPYTYGRMRIRSGYNHYFTGADACADDTQFSGETEDYWVNIVCGPNSGPQIAIIPTNTTICKGQTAKLTGSGGTQYTWTPGNVYNSTVIVSPIVTTVYTLTAKGPNCPNAVSKKTINVIVSIPNVVGTPDKFTMCVEDANTITGAGANTYTWTDQSSGPTTVFTATAAGDYTIGVSGHDVWGCLGEGVTSIKVEECTGIRNLSSATGTGLNIYPNPAAGSFVIRSANYREVKIFDQLGRLFESFSFDGTQTEKTVTGFPGGIYFVWSTGEAGTSCTRLVVVD